jgi:hypothetical protein
MNETTVVSEHIKLTLYSTSLISIPCNNLLAFSLELKVIEETEAITGLNTVIAVVDNVDSGTCDVTLDSKKCKQVQPKTITTSRTHPINQPPST